MAIVSLCIKSDQIGLKADALYEKQYRSGLRSEQMVPCDNRWRVLTMASIRGKMMDVEDQTAIIVTIICENLTNL